MTGMAFPTTARTLPSGTLVSSTPITLSLPGAKAFRVVYLSRGVGGGMRNVSGVIIVPDGPVPMGGRNIIAWAHGTFGVAEKCAPSASPQLAETIAGLTGMIARGYIVAATDYAGLGTPGPHPYLAGDASAYAVLDSVRAARMLVPQAASRTYAVWGESQGAHAALWAGQYAATYAPELTLAGVAAAAPPTDLKENLTGGTNAAIRALLTAYTGESWSKVYDIPLSTILKPTGQSLVRRLAQNCVSTDPVALRTKIGLFRLTRSLARVDISTSAPWAKRLRQNSLTPRGFSTPVLIAQGSADPIVAAAVTQTFVQKICRLEKTPVRYLSIKGGDHFSIGKRSADVTVSWIGDRFSGQPAPSDCNRF